MVAGEVDDATLMRTGAVRRVNDCEAWSSETASMTGGIKEYGCCDDTS